MSPSQPTGLHFEERSGENDAANEGPKEKGKQDVFRGGVFDAFGFSAAGHEINAYNLCMVFQSDLDLHRCGFRKCVAGGVRGIGRSGSRAPKLKAVFRTALQNLAANWTRVVRSRVVGIREFTARSAVRAERRTLPASWLVIFTRPLTLALI